MSREESGAEFPSCLWPHEVNVIMLRILISLLLRCLMSYLLYVFESEGLPRVPEVNLMVINDDLDLDALLTPIATVLGIL